MSLYNLVTDNSKEYDFDTELCLNIIYYSAIRQGWIPKMKIKEANLFNTVGCCILKKKG
jgi:hypothetical protein